MYNVVLDLTDAEVKQMKQLALDRDTSVRGLIAQLVRDALPKQETKKEVT